MRGRVGGDVHVDIVPKQKSEGHTDRRNEEKQNHFPVFYLNFAVFSARPDSPGAGRRGRGEQTRTRLHSSSSSPVTVSFSHLGLLYFIKINTPPPTPRRSHDAE